MRHTESSGPQRPSMIWILILLLGLSMIVVMLDQWLAGIGMVTPFPA